MNPKVTECKNCGNNSWGGLGAEGSTTTAGLISVEKTADGSVGLNGDEILIVTPVICDNCGNVLLFAN